MAPSFETVCAALGLDWTRDGVQLLPAAAFIPPPAIAQGTPAATGADRAWSELHGVGPYVPPLVPFPAQPTRPLLVFDLTPSTGAALRQALESRYSADHPLTLLPADGSRAELTVADLADQAALFGAWAYLPALPIERAVRTMDAVEWVMARLAGPFGCPWDREQTHESLKVFLLEETHETLEALDAEDWPAVRDELGDLLLQVVFHAELARQAGRFDFGDIARAINTKLIRRHPHIFGDVAVSGAAEVLKNWDAIKAEERAEQGKTDRKSLLDGIPKSLPVLTTAQHLGHKASKVGFDWPTIDGVWDKVAEELEEIRAASPEERAAEFGDVLFAICDLARWMRVDAESALRMTIAKFRSRFAHIEAAAAAQGREVASLTPEEADALWNEAKKL